MFANYCYLNLNNTYRKNHIMQDTVVKFYDLEKS